MKLSIHIFFALLLVPTIALAQASLDIGQISEETETPFVYKYDKKYRPEAYKGQGSPSQTLLPASNFSMNFVQSRTTNPDEAVLRFTQPVSATGCATVLSPKTERLDQGAVLMITIGAPILSLDSKPQYGHNQCANRPQSVQTDIILNRKKLAENGTKNIIFKNDYGMDKYSVEIGRHYLRLKSQSDTLFTANKAIRNKDPLIHYFYPKGTMVLSVPQAKTRGAIEKKIRSYAGSRGLTPLSTEIEEFEVLGKNSKDFYFIDASGHIADDLATMDEQNSKILLGTMHVPETYEGPSGAYEENIALNVYARLPGTLDWNK